MGQKLEVVNAMKPENFTSGEGRTRNLASIMATIGVTTDLHFTFIFSQDLSLGEKAQSPFPPFLAPPIPTGDNQLEVLQ